MSEVQTANEMPAVAGEGTEVTMQLAKLNAEAKKIKSSARLRDQKEKKKDQFLVEIGSSSSSCAEIEEVVPPTPSKFKLDLLVYNVLYCTVDLLEETLRIFYLLEKNPGKRKSSDTNVSGAGGVAKDKVQRIDQSSDVSKFYFYFVQEQVNMFEERS